MDPLVGHGFTELSTDLVLIWLTALLETNLGPAYAWMTHRWAARRWPDDERCTPETI